MHKYVYGPCLWTLFIDLVYPINSVMVVWTNAGMYEPLLSFHHSANSYIMTIQVAKFLERLLNDYGVLALGC